MTRAPGNDLKIFGLTLSLAGLMLIIAYTAANIDAEYLFLVFFLLVALLVFGVFFKSDPRFKILAWSMIWTSTFYVALGLFIFIFLLTYGPHGVC